MRMPVILLLTLASCDAAPDRPVSSDGVRHAGGAAAPAGSVARGSAADRAALRDGPRALDARAGVHGYRVFCAPCHGPAGGGDGPVIARGFTPPRAFAALSPAERDERRTVAIITGGYRTMLPQGEQIPAADRWAIAGHVRRLAERGDADAR